MNQAAEQKLLDYLGKQSTPRRVVQICDALDLEVDDVEALVSMLTRSGQVFKSEAQAPNRLMANAYSINPAHPGWTAPKTANVGPSAVAAAPAGQGRLTVIAAAAAAAAQGKGRITKVDLALAHLREFGATDAAAMAIAMNIPVPSSVGAYLKDAIKDGRIVRIENTFSLPPVKSTAPVPAPLIAAEVAAIAPVPEMLDLTGGRMMSIENKASSTPAESTTPAPLIIPVLAPPAPATAARIAPAQARAPKLPTPLTPSELAPHAVDQDVIALLRDRLSPAEFGGYLKANVIALTLWPQHGAADYRRAGVFVDLLADHAVEMAA